MHALFIAMMHLNKKAIVRGTIFNFNYTFKIGIKSRSELAFVREFHTDCARQGTPD